MRGIGEGDLVHVKSQETGEYDHNEVYEVVDAFCDPNEFEWYVKANLIRPWDIKRPFKFRFDCVKKVCPLVALAICASNEDE